MTEPDGYGYEIDCLMLLDEDDEDTINEIWAQATLNQLNTQQNEQINC